MGVNVWSLVGRVLRWVLACACACAPLAAQAGDTRVAAVRADEVALPPVSKPRSDAAAFFWRSATGLPAERAWTGEARAAGLALTAGRTIGRHRLAATIAGFGVGEPARAPLAEAGAFQPDRPARLLQPAFAPALADEAGTRPRYGHPLLDADRGLRRRTGFYGKLAWTAPLPVRVEALHADNAVDPATASGDRPRGWRTSFNALGLVAEVGRGFDLRAQVLSGRTRMADRIGGRDGIDMRFRAASATATRRFGRAALSARLDLFGSRNQGSAIAIADDERGWALALGARRSLAPRVSFAAEYLHAESDRWTRLRAAPALRRPQDQLQMVMRAAW